MVSIPESYQDIFQKKAFAHLATLDADGTPQVTPVWIEYDGQHILVNSATGRKKDRNMRERPSVALSVQDPDNAYRYVGVQGRVTDITEEGAEAHIHRLSRRYTGHDYGRLQAGESRVIYKIIPEQVWTMG